MKKNNIHIIILFVIITLFSCNSNNKEQLIPVLQNISFLLCNNEENNNIIASNMKNDDEREYIKYFATNKQTLKFEQKLLTNCCCENIEINSNLSDNNVIININESGEECNCICPSILNYEVTNLQTGVTYMFKFMRNSHEYYSLKITFSANEDEIIFID